MGHKSFLRRLLVLGGFFVICMAVFATSMFSAQLVHGKEYLAQSVRTNTRSESVEAARGIITDRNGKVLVSNRPVYTLDFDASLVPEDALDDASARLLALLDAQGIAHTDVLPHSGTVATDIDANLISLLKDGDFAGVQIKKSSVRMYETNAAAHILGRVTKIPAEQWEEYHEKGYAINDLVGCDGVEAAFEDDLRGTDGRRLVTRNDSGKIIDARYSVEPQPGDTVVLTIDIDFQQQVEDILAETCAAMVESDRLDHPAAAAVVQVGTGDVLALASYPTFSLSSFNEDYAALREDPRKPMWNRATQGVYAPGSTVKPLTAVASLESGVTTVSERVFDSGKWAYPGHSASYTYCWNRDGHGPLDVTGAITNSCNYYFAEMGYRLGMDRLRSYFSAFGLGEHTGIEIGDAVGVLPSQEAGTNLAPWAAYGQANQLYTPLQLAGYIATLAGGGERYAPHLLKEVRPHNCADPIAVYNEPPVETIPISSENLDAVLTGMHDLVKTGAVSGCFRDCIVDAAAKTGTAQTGDTKNTNGVFVCFAPYDEPQIAVALVIEKGQKGAALASSAVQILNAYFSSADGSAEAGESIR